jgi:branched-chain amino acid transport system substrate-binding protein
MLSQLKRSVVFLAALVAGAAMADQAPIKIGVVGPFANKSSGDMGVSIRGGAKVFEDEVNASGGLLGRKIELVFKDDDAKPEQGVRAAKELIEQDKVVAAVGYANTGVAIPSARVFQEAKVPLIVSTSTGAEVVRQFAPPRASTSYIFRIAAHDQLQPVVLLNDLVDRRKITSIAILHDESPYGQFGRDKVLAEMERRGIKPVAVSSFKVGDSEMSEQVMKARDAGAKALLLYALSTDSANVVKAAAHLNYNPAIVGSWTLSQKAFIEQAGKAGEGVRMPVTYVEYDLSQRSKAFSDAYRRINKMDRIPAPVSAAQTYDALRLLFVAMFQAGSTEPDAIRKALEDLKFPTYSTMISRYDHPFSAADHEAVTGNMVVMGEVRNGRVVYAYDEDAKSALISRTKK